jgi:hypothetical protein
MFSFLTRMKSSGASGTHPCESTQSVLSISTVTPLPESVCGAAIGSSRLNNATLKVRPMDADADAPAQDTAFSNEERVPLLGEPFAIDQHCHGEARSGRVAERGRALHLMLFPNSGILLGQKRTGIECRLE